jgi:hypothetical protein
MKNVILLLFVSILSVPAFAQQDDMPIDESLIVKILSVTNKGYISRTDIPKATQLDINEKDSKIISFILTYKSPSGEVMEIHNQGAEFSEQVKTRLTEFKIGSKFTIEHIVVENASGTVLARPALFTVKS